MANLKKSRTRSKVERLVDIMFSGAEVPAESMSGMRAWLVDSDKEKEKSDALYEKFVANFKFDPNPVLAVQLWPELARRLGMDKTPTVPETDPLGFGEPAAHSKPASDTGTVRTVRSTILMRRRIAAVLVPLLVVGGVALWLAGRDSADIVEISVPMGETRTIELPYGSTIEAKSGATISYDEANFAENRVVSLSGEAMFDVAEALNKEGAKIPFTVEADNLTVNVLGTVFNLSAGGENAGTAELSLYEGSVAISLGGNEEATHESDSARFETTVAAGERLTVNTATSEHTLKLIPASEMARLGFMPLLRFDEATLEDIAAVIEMNYGVEVDFAEGVDPTEGRYSGNLEELLLDEALELLSRIDIIMSFERSSEGRVKITHK